MKADGQNTGSLGGLQNRRIRHRLLKDLPSEELKSEDKKITDIICFSHLRWNFIYQRPQHLLSRWAKEAKVYYFEEPVFGKYKTNYLNTSTSIENVQIITPHIKEGLTPADVNAYLESTIIRFIKWNKIKDFLLWYITPMALPYSQNLKPKMIVYDCMEEPSNFPGDHTDIEAYEASLLNMTDVVFTGGHHLYEYKKDRHSNIHPFPSSIDQKHFESGIGSTDPADQAPIPFPRIGYFGVIDERLNIKLLDELSRKMPESHFIMIGPIGKIDPSILPKNKNIHYLGQKDYKELPKYLGNWDVAILPYAKNNSTRFSSPAKTREYLCARKPVVSTYIHDVAIPYGQLGLVHIADTVDEFAEALNQAYLEKDDKNWQSRVSELLKVNSWDFTWSRMKRIIMDTLEKKEMIRQEVEKLNIGPLNGRMSGDISTLPADIS